MARKGRESGFYWVKFEGNWIVAEYYNFTHHWELCGVYDKHYERDFEAINETRLTPPC